MMENAAAASRRSSSRRTVLVGAGLLSVGAVSGHARRAVGQPVQPVRIGVLTDMNGPYGSITGTGSILAAQLAVADFLKQNPGLAIDVISADMQAKPDLSVNIARDWFDRGGVDVIIDVPSSAGALAVAGIAKERNKVALFTAPATTDLTGKACGPNHVQWTFDTYSLAVAVARAIVEEGGKKWFFLQADYNLGETMVRDASQVITANGGQVLGTVKHPFPDVTDFSSFLLTAKASGADVIGLANAGTDTVNCIRQVGEFGLTSGGTKVAALLAEVAEIDAIGLSAAQGLYMANAFYWDLNAGTRDFSARLQPAIKARRPSQQQAGAYSATLHYLKTVVAMGPAAAKASGAATVAKMKSIPCDDPVFGSGSIRADGRKLHPMLLLQAKSPSESRYAWDYMRVVRSIPAEAAFRPMNPGLCALAAD